MDALGIKEIVSHGGGARDAWGIWMKSLVDSLFVGDARALGTLRAHAALTLCAVYIHTSEKVNLYLPIGHRSSCHVYMHMRVQRVLPSRSRINGVLFEIAEETDLNKEVQIAGSAVIGGSTIDIAHPSPESRCPQLLNK